MKNHWLNKQNLFRDYDILKFFGEHVGICAFDVSNPNRILLTEKQGMYSFLTSDLYGDVIMCAERELFYQSLFCHISAYDGSVYYPSELLGICTIDGNPNYKLYFVRVPVCENQDNLNHNKVFWVNADEVFESNSILNEKSSKRLKFLIDILNKINNCEYNVNECPYMIETLGAL